MVYIYALVYKYVYVLYGLRHPLDVTNVVANSTIPVLGIKNAIDQIIRVQIMVFNNFLTHSFAVTYVCRKIE